MAKSFTDIEQSKKLAEILPIETADMSWTNNKLKKLFDPPVFRNKKDSSGYFF